MLLTYGEWGFQMAREVGAGKGRWQSGRRKVAGEEKWGSEPEST